MKIHHVELGWIYFTQGRFKRMMRYGYGSRPSREAVAGVLLQKTGGTPFGGRVAIVSRRQQRNWGKDR